jgi:alkylation response protein AidB-like acyl-CoA dehydrogenase
MSRPTSNEILDAARALGPTIEAAADEIDRLRCLPDDLVDALRSAGVFRAAFPVAWGGPEMTILDQVRLIETLAYHDASTAWVAMICSDSGHYAGRLPEPVARELYPSMDLLTAGLLYPVGQATRVEGGFRVTGRWQFGSGCLHAERIVGGCMVFDGGAPVFDGDGRPEMFVAWLPRADVEIHDTWYTTGLAGSGSNDYSVTDAFVPDAHRFDPFSSGCRPEPLYGYHGFFFANLPGVALGCARRMVDDLKDVMRTKVSMPGMVRLKDEYRAQLALAEVTTALGAATAYQDETLTSIWTTVVAGAAPTLEQRSTLALMLVHAVQTAHGIAETVCEVVGAQSIYRTSPFERRRRDLATVAAHVVGQRKSAATAAMLLLGDLPPFTYV